MDGSTCGVNLTAMWSSRPCAGSANSGNSIKGSRIEAIRSNAMELKCKVVVTSSVGGYGVSMLAFCEWMKI